MRLAPKVRHSSVCRTFGARPKRQGYPGLPTGPTDYRSFGPNQVLHPIVTIKRDIH
jgi:hypothetical protein